MARIIEIVKECEQIVIHNECGAKIGYYKNEIKSYVCHDYGGGSDKVYFIKCPNCGEYVIINVK